MSDGGSGRGRGRGWYYKQMYGGGGRGGAGRGGGGRRHEGGAALAVRQPGVPPCVARRLTVPAACCSWHAEEGGSRYSEQGQGQPYQQHQGREEADVGGGSDDDGYGAGPASNAGQAAAVDACRISMLHRAVAAMRWPCCHGDPAQCWPALCAGSASDLAAALRRIDGRGYKAYKVWRTTGRRRCASLAGSRAARHVGVLSCCPGPRGRRCLCCVQDIEGRWQMGAQQGGYVLCVDWVQGDPFASPSRCRWVRAGSEHSPCAAGSNASCAARNDCPSCSSCPSRDVCGRCCVALGAGLWSQPAPRRCLRSSSAAAPAAPPSATFLPEALGQRWPPRVRPACHGCCRLLLFGGAPVTMTVPAPT